MAGLLQDKVAMATGSGSGLGRSAALAFAREGAKVVVADIDAQNGAETVDMIRKAGGDAVFVKTDVTSEADVEALVAAVVKNYGKLDCAFNNVGIDLPPIVMWEGKEEDWHLLMDTNLKSVWLGLKHELKQMVKQGHGGSIVNTSSIAGATGAENFAIYSASKTGMIGLSRSAALECAKYNIRINVICPAGMKGTAMYLDMVKNNPEIVTQVVDKVPLRRDSDPAEIAEAVLWLLSDRSSYATGMVMNIDGGLTAQ